MNPTKKRIRTEDTNPGPGAVFNNARKSNYRSVFNHSNIKYSLSNNNSKSKVHYTHDTLNNIRIYEGYTNKI